VSVDPITVEIIRCALKAAANEMSVVLKRTAYNMMIYEVQDYCVSIVDHEGRTMSQNEGALPIFLADLGVAVEDGVQIYGLENIRPGDVFLVCSDGLHGYVDEADITRLIGRGSPERASEELVELTLANGAPDNVTVIAIWASEPTLLSLPDPVKT